MEKIKLTKKLKVLSVLILGLILISPNFKNFVEADITQTSVIVHVCGNSVKEGEEFCDDGSNNGRYAYNAGDRFCNSDCSGWAPYCGDGILQGGYGEECDDGNNNAGDGCSAICKTEEGPPPPGGGGGGVLPPVETKVILKGKAYPDSDIHFLKDGKEIPSAKADSKADFTREITEITPGIYTFSIWAEDKDGIKSITYTLTFRVIANAITTVSGIFLPPTIGVDKTALKSGEILNIFGQTAPQLEVDVHILSSEIIKKVTSDNIGAWLLPFDTKSLEEGVHITKARFQLNGQEMSGFGKVLSFYIGEAPPLLAEVCPRADFNKDGRVNLVDFSIFLCWWGKINPEVDLNNNGIVDLPDFSIFLCCWTG
ncbi:MAG: DUF4215 domain-containing protein [Candidatus Nealsonbacteria bacterium]|nr:DUF4215 domain-containing protein [Candidatus Nealsonbacteria bacterium]